MKFNTRIANAVAFICCAGLMAYALYAEHVLGLEPCPLCIFQRVALIASGMLFLLAALHNPGVIGRRIYGSLQIAALIAGIAIACRHIWVQAQPPGTVAACGAGLDYLLNVLPLWDVITKVLTGSGECAKIEWRFLGLSMPWWVLGSFVTLAWVSLRANLWARSPR